MYIHKCTPATAHICAATSVQDTHTLQAFIVAKFYTYKMKLARFQVGQNRASINAVNTMSEKPLAYQARIFKGQSYDFLRRCANGNDTKNDSRTKMAHRITIFDEYFLALSTLRIAGGYPEDSEWMASE